MIELSVGGNRIRTVFHLMGFHENDLTKSLGWVLSQSPALERLLISQVLGADACKISRVRLQRYDGKHGGFTDVEIEVEDTFLVVLEAKRFWDLPGETQLRKYAERISAYRGGRIVSVSQWSPRYAEQALRQVIRENQIAIGNGRLVDVSHLSWTDLRRMARAARNGASNAEKQWLNALIDYLEDVMNEQNQRSNMVFVVPLGARAVDEKGVLTRDYVKKNSLYWYPVGKNRLKKSPNYLAFCWEGQLRSIHHVEQSEYTDARRQSKLLAPIAKTLNDPHLVFKLGPGFAPPRTVKAHVQRSQWCMLDALLTSLTVAEAGKATKARLDGRDLVGEEE